ncbi:acyltransferase family protein [Agromyces sp. SYSU T0242]|uniref:acyltransferase family protein n=1 Tax=Agromyces litoreus TaxID=3158561 RepID=UPI003397B455
MASLADPTRAVDAPATRAGSSTAFRADIQALRALAVAAVVLFHLWPSRLSGGYVGVDVFFVISGYLITSHLLREATDRGRIALGAFWARRARRLLPASLLVLLVTALAVVAVVPESRWAQFLREVVAATFYVENWSLSFDAVDYLAAENAPSPVQHFWSLSVEEQFYIAVPLLLVAALAIARRRGLDIRRALLLALAGVAVLSFAVSIWLTSVSQPLGYFSTATRAWEFALGGVIAFLPALGRGWTANAIAGAGLVMIVSTAWFFDETTPFPGWLAAVPAVGTAAVIAAASGALGRVGTWAPVGWIGSTSYAIYLWHWPLIVLVPYATGRPLDTVAKLAVLGATLVLATASTRFVEDPVRKPNRVLGPTNASRRVAIASVTGMALIASTCLLTMHDLSTRQAARADVLARIVEEPPACFGAGAVASAGCTDADLDGVLAPHPAIAGDDGPARPDCWGRDGRGDAKVCVIGPEDGYDARFFAMGDSHNYALVPAYERLAEERNWRIDFAGIGGCYWTTRPQEQPSDAAEAGCLQWRSSALERMHGIDGLDAVLVTHSGAHGHPIPEPGESVERATVEGQVEAWRDQGPPGVPIIAIVDNPAMEQDTAACVAREGADAGTECAVPRDRAFRWFDGQREAAERVPGVRVVDLSDLYCAAAACSPVIGHAVVYRDATHVTATWARTLAPVLADRIEDALSR